MSKKIAIIGAGPSGVSAAIFLTKQGFEVTIIDRESKADRRLKIGESLPPDAYKLLQELEVWENFQSDGHLKCFGNKSAWGSSQLAFTDFIHHPIGHGWHIDRIRFETMLKDKATELGAVILEETSVKDAIYKGSDWTLRLKNKEGKTFKAQFDFLVDASGRNSWLARRQGVKRLYEDQQLALIAFLKTSKTLEDTTSLIETTPSGWWYSTKIPNDQIATAFLCKPQKPEREQWLLKEQWWALIRKAKHTADRMNDCEAELLEPPYFVSADSSILEVTYGKGWIAVGDAAMAYDPIASHGILMAMVSGRDASKTIAQHFKGDKDAMKSYNALLWAAFQHYVQQRQQFYEAEQRFSDSPYWAMAVTSQPEL